MADLALNNYQYALIGVATLAYLGVGFRESLRGFRNYKDPDTNHWVLYATLAPVAWLPVAVVFASGWLVSWPWRTLAAKAARERKREEAVEEYNQYAKCYGARRTEMEKRLMDNAEADLRSRLGAIGMDVYPKLVNGDTARELVLTTAPSKQALSAAGHHTKAKASDMTEDEFQHFLDCHDCRDRMVKK